MIKTLQGFRDFIMRGNVIDLAVGIVIGAAFSSVVGALTDSFFTPLIRAIGGGGPKAGAWTVNGQSVDWARFVNAVITFMITAAVLYFFVVLPMNSLAERRKKGEIPPPDKPSEEVLLLTQIRDALLADGGAAKARVAAGIASEAKAPTHPEPAETADHAAPVARRPNSGSRDGSGSVKRP